MNDTSSHNVPCGSFARKLVLPLLESCSHELMITFSTERWILIQGVGNIVFEDLFRVFDLCYFMPLAVPVVCHIAPPVGRADPSDNDRGLIPAGCVQREPGINSLVRQG